MFIDWKLGMIGLDKLELLTSLLKETIQKHDNNKI